MPYIPGNIRKRLRTIWLWFAGNSYNSSIQMSGGEPPSSARNRRNFTFLTALALWVFRKYFQPLDPLGQINAVWNLVSSMHPFSSSWCKLFCWPDYNVTVDAEIDFSTGSWSGSEWPIYLNKSWFFFIVCMKFESPVWLDSTSECVLVKNLSACRWYELHMQPRFQGAQLISTSTSV